MNKSKRKVIAEDTVRIIEAGSYMSPAGHLIELKGGIEKCMANTICHLPGDRHALVRTNRPTGGTPAKLSVYNETSLEGARALLASGAERVACLNFASAKNPGGGFLGGSEAQEEAICRPSALYASLNTQFDIYYTNNRNCSNGLYTDHLIYSPNVPVFKDEKGELLNEPYIASFITSPAPNRGAIEQNNPELATELETVFRRRIEQVLAAMVHHGHKNIVLGAWGCGVFRNSPLDVAGWFRDALIIDGWINGFDQIRFSVLDRVGEQKTYLAFLGELSELANA